MMIHHHVIRLYHFQLAVSLGLFLQLNLHLYVRQRIYVNEEQLLLLIVQCFDRGNIDRSGAKLLNCARHQIKTYPKEERIKFLS